MPILSPQQVSVRPVAAAFPGLIGDITNLGTGEVIASGAPSWPPENAFDNIVSWASSWWSEQPASADTYIGWDWVTARPRIRRATCRRAWNQSNNSAWPATLALEISDNLATWIEIGRIEGLSRPPADSYDATPVVIDVAEPIPARAARLRMAALSGNVGYGTNIVEAEFIENLE
ncbi:hypothetical protein [Roseospirillum parvum]|uniref:F5/8 type C domain-containing protein n=1 Tax=Roseospirillum parvum TaxID=83401 RepID=A0A1G8G1H3_9PROT|nr:hypothetical protein [Roseospirillum parvum]SDH88140.1 hypothetical protein SAMN05421742_11810 [Roseospirillum parvum]